MISIPFSFHQKTKEAFASLRAALRAVFRYMLLAGTIGQSGAADGSPVASLSVRVAADAVGNAVFDGKWFARPGEKKPRALSKTLAGTVMSDGERIYCVSLYGTTVREATFKGDALVQVGEPVRITGFRLFRSVKDSAEEVYAMVSVPWRMTNPSYRS